MKNNQQNLCINNEHIWADKVESGFLNEIVTFRKLTSTEIDIKYGRVCPKGIIVCINCGTKLFHLEKVSGFINIDDRGWNR